MESEEVIMRVSAVLTILSKILNKTEGAILPVVRASLSADDYDA